MFNYDIEHEEEWKLPVTKVTDLRPLNPFLDDGVEMYFAWGNRLPFQNTKFITVMGLLRDIQEKFGSRVTRIVEGSSGNTGNMFARLAPHVLNIAPENILLVAKDDIPAGKKNPMLMAGARVIPPEPGLSGIQTARKMGGGGWKEEGWGPHEDGTLNPDQYANIAGTDLHHTFTAEQILGQVPRVPDVVAAAIGTGGTIVGVGDRLREEGSKKIIGALLASNGKNEPKEEVPGIRTLEDMKEITLPWKFTVKQEDRIFVRARPSYLASMWIGWMTGDTPGPSSGTALLGALEALGRAKLEHKLDDLRGDDGKIIVVVLLPDGSAPYAAERFLAMLPAEWQHPSSAPQPSQLILNNV